MSSNRKVHLLTATGAFAEVREPYRAVGQTAYQSHAEALREIPAFVARCEAEADDRLFQPVPGSVKGRVQTLDLVDTVDGAAEVAYLLSGSGPSGVFNGAFRCIHRRVFTDRAEAERAVPGFVLACETPLDDALDHAMTGRFKVSLVEVALAPEPAEA